MVQVKKEIKKIPCWILLINLIEDKGRGQKRKKRTWSLRGQDMMNRFSI